MGSHPQLTCTAYSDALGETGYLAVYNWVHGRSFGGVRLVPDIDCREMDLSARTMAYKWAFIGFPMGGAKAAVRIAPNTRAGREEVLRHVGRTLSPLIRTGAFVPGIDMNCALDDLQLVLQGAGVQQDVSGWKNLSHVHTARSCGVATLVALESRGMDAHATTYAIQGFGKVGMAYAQLLDRLGAKLVAISNTKGAIANEEGLDVADLIDKRRVQGDAFITRYPGAEPVTHEQVFECEAHVLLPAARAWAVHEQNHRRIRADIIVCAANVAMDDDIERYLHEQRKIVITDFVSNCGGILGSVLEREVSEATIFKILDTLYRQKISQLLQRSAQTGRPLYALARAESEARMAAWRHDRRSWFEKGARWLRRKTPEALRRRRYLRFYEELWCVG